MWVQSHTHVGLRIDLGPDRRERFSYFPLMDSPSDAQHAFRGLLQKLADSMGAVPDSDLLADGQFLLVDGSLEIAILLHEPTASVRLNAPVAELAGDESADFFRTLLDANLFWAGTAGATLSLEPVSNRIFIQDKMPLSSLEFPVFESWLSGFIEAARSWMLSLANLTGSAGGSGIVMPDPTATV